MVAAVREGVPAVSTCLLGVSVRRATCPARRPQVACRSRQPSPVLPWRLSSAWSQMSDPHKQIAAGLEQTRHLTRVTLVLRD